MVVDVVVQEVAVDTVRLLMVRCVALWITKVVVLHSASVQMDMETAKDIFLRLTVDTRPDMDPMVVALAILVVIPEVECMSNLFILQDVVVELVVVLQDVDVVQQVAVVELESCVD